MSENHRLVDFSCNKNRFCCVFLSFRYGFTQHSGISGLANYLSEILLPPVFTGFAADLGIGNTVFRFKLT